MRAGRKVSAAAVASIAALAAAVAAGAGGAAGGGAARHCDGGAVAVPPAAIDDDFCDCVDGSDEPHTAACASGRFSCDNRGSLPLVLPASRVGDGICDCCDGSDERASTAGCPDTCAAEGARLRDAARAEARTAREGMLIRERLVREGADAIAKRRADAVGSAGKIAEAEARAAEACAARDALEEANRLDESEGATEHRADEYDFGGEGAPNGHSDSDEEADDVHLQEGGGEDTEVGSGEGEAEEAELSAEERGRLVAARWQGEDNVEGASAGPPTYDTFDDAYSGEMPYGDHYHGEYRDYLGMKTFDDYLPRDDSAPPELIEARENAQAAERELADARKTAEDAAALETKLKDGTYGPAAEYLPLDGECFTGEDSQYTYEVCPFGEAKQKAGLSSTRLGSFAGWSAPEGVAPGEHGSAMLFEGGDMCPGGLARSAEVALVCGVESGVRAFAEPERCAYTAEWVTPAACTESAANAAGAALERIERAITAAKRGGTHDELRR